MSVGRPPEPSDPKQEKNPTRIYAIVIGGLVLEIMLMVVLARSCR